MSVTRCLKCDEPVLIPGGTSLKAIVRCPHCQEQFELGELLDEIPAVLEIVEDPEAIVEAAAAADGVSVVVDKENAAAEGEQTSQFHFDFGGDAGRASDADSDQTTQTTESEVGSAKTAPAFDFDSSSKVNAGAGGSATTPFRSSPRVRRKEKNPVIEIAKVLGGGVLGIVIAILGIWWVGRIDPFKLAPKVSGVAPWILPAELRGGRAGDDPADDLDRGKDGGWEYGTGDDTGGRGPKITDRERFERGNESFASPFDSDSNIKTTVEDAPSDNRSGNQGQTTVVQDLADSTGIRNTPVTTPEVLEQAVDEAVAALHRWVPEEDVDTDRLGQDALDAIQELGKCIATAYQSDSANRLSVTRTHEILRSLQGNNRKLAAVNAWAVDQLKSDEAQVSGILLTGTINSIEMQGEMYEIRLELPTEEREEVAVITKDDPTSFSPPGSTVIVIGLLVNDPVANFADYGGTDAQVIRCGRLDLLRPLDAKNEES